MLEERRICDIYGTQQDVMEIRNITEVRLDGEWITAATHTANLTKQARFRLYSLLARAFNKPRAEIGIQTDAAKDME